MSIDFENEDLGKFPESMVVKFLSEIKIFSSCRSKEKFVSWCFNHRLYALLSHIANVDYKHV